MTFVRRVAGPVEEPSREGRERRRAKRGKRRVCNAIVDDASAALDLLQVSVRRGVIRYRDLPDRGRKPCEVRLSGNARGPAAGDREERARQHGGAEGRHAAESTS